MYANLNIASFNLILKSVSYYKDLCNACNFRLHALVSFDLCQMPTGHRSWLSGILNPSQNQFAHLLKAQQNLKQWNIVYIKWLRHDIDFRTDSYSQLVFPHTWFSTAQNQTISQQSFSIDCQFKYQFNSLRSESVNISRRLGPILLKWRIGDCSRTRVKGSKYSDVRPISNNNVIINQTLVLLNLLNSPKTPMYFEKNINHLQNKIKATERSIKAGGYEVHSWGGSMREAPETTRVFD